MADTKKSSKGSVPAKKTTEKNSTVESSSTAKQNTEPQSTPEGKPSKAENIISVVLGLAVVIVIGAMIFNAIKGRQEQQTATTPDVQEATVSAMHTVAAGETLWRIAEQYYQDGYKWVDIQRANNLDTGDTVEVGDVLIIPVVKVEGNTIAMGPTGATGITETPTTAPEPTSTPEPTQVPPTATPRDLNLGGLLATSTPEPTQVPPTATPRDLLSLFKNAVQNRPTSEPTQAPTNTPESTEMSATGEITQVPPTSTVEPTQAPTNTPEPTVAPTVEPTRREIVRPTNTPEVEQNTSSTSTEKQYTVQQGDSLWSIAQQAYNDPYKWTEIAKANNLMNPNVIHVGNTFILP